MKLTCVIENTATIASEFYAEHGLSILVEEGNSKVLFDTGKSSDILKRNMNLLNGFEGLKYVVLSHGHYDHTGGLSQILKNSSADILMHEKAILPKYVSRNGEMKFIGTRGEFDNEGSIDNLDARYLSKVKFISKTTEIIPNIFIFAQISLNYGFEEIDPSFFIREGEKFLRDSFDDEVVLVIKTDHGLVILSGCAHRGILNTVSSVAEYFNENVYAVIGGTHLVTANEDRLLKTVIGFEKFDPKHLIFGHCNGFDALCMFKKVFKNKFQMLESGKEIVL